MYIYNRPCRRGYKRSKTSFKNPSNAYKYIIPKIESLYEKWRQQQKTSSRKTEKDQMRQKAYREDFENLFDIVPFNVLNMFKSEEDKIFLENQWKKGRKGCILSACDLNVYAKENRIIERKHKEQERFNRCKQSEPPASKKKMACEKL